MLLWGLIIPLLPLMLVIVPKVWQAIDPMATITNLPGWLGISRGRPMPVQVQQYGYFIAVILFLVIVPTRKVLLNTHGLAAAALIAGLLVLAFVEGLMFHINRGSSSSINPLLPLQYLYAHRLRAPYNGQFWKYHLFFVGALPGLTVAYYIIPGPPAITIGAMYLQFAFYGLVSLGSFFALNAIDKGARHTVTLVYAAAALNLYYWFNVPFLAYLIGAISGVTLPSWIAWFAQFSIVVLSVQWFIHHYRRAAAGPSLEPEGMADPPADSGPAHARQRGHSQARGDTPAGPQRALPRDAAPYSSGIFRSLTNDLPLPLNIPTSSLRSKRRLAQPSTAEQREPLPVSALLAQLPAPAPSARRRTPPAPLLAPAQLPEPNQSMSVSFAVDPAIKQVVIVGNGMAGVSAANAIRHYHPTCNVHLIGRRQQFQQNQDGAEPQFFKGLNTPVVRINREEQHVVLHTGEKIAYDRLILAMGSRRTAPPLPGFGLPGTDILREASDALALQGFVERYLCRHAVITDNGPLGLAACVSLHKLGMQIYIVSRAGQLLPRQLDARANRLLRAYLEGLQIARVIQDDIAGIHGTDRVRHVLLDGGGTLPCDLLFAAAQLQPNIALAREAGLRVNRGVIVDDYLRTSAPEILAAGDVVEHEGQIYALWPAPVKQAYIAALNAVGGSIRYGGTMPLTTLNIMSLEITSIGRIEPETEDDIVIVFEDSETYWYRKLIIAQGRIVGAILFGHQHDASLVKTAIKQQVDVRPCLDQLRAGDWSVLSTLVR